jgi:predicted metal-dependent peptidase
MAKKRGNPYKDNIAAINEGRALSGQHPLVNSLPGFSLITDGRALLLGQEEWLCVCCEKPIAYPGLINVEPETEVSVWPNVRRREEVEIWAYLFARICVHIAMDHMDPERDDLPWHQACWYFADEMVSIAGIGRRPSSFPPILTGLPRENEKALAAYLKETSTSNALEALSLSKLGQRFWTFSGAFKLSDALREQRKHDLARGIRKSASQAVDIAGGARKALGTGWEIETVFKRARDWVISEFPLLAALASSFHLIEDEALCQAMHVEVAAISDQTHEIYVNPKIRFSEEEARFIMAHELLHAGLRHSMRRQGRDSWFWNIACDFVINDWLMEMDVGRPPDHVGYLYDPSLHALSAEEVYDRIVADLRWMRKLRKAQTLNGRGVDILDGQQPAGWWQGGGVDLDAFYRRALNEGLELYLGKERGYLPAGLIEEIRSLSQPPIPWDVELAHWLDQYFPPIVLKRSYSRAHRRQSATPEIPRPAWVSPDEQRASRVFGAVIDTSGSMNRAELGKAVGAIASYAMSREVAFVRLIQCDAAAQDEGYVAPESLLGRVRIKGRGGTALMPGIRCLEEAPDFPNDGPVLIITDGACDKLTIKRNHAFLLVEGGRLPFQAKGPVFYFS